MRIHKTLLGLSALMLLGGCPTPPEPPPPPPPAPQLTTLEVKCNNATEATVLTGESVQCTATAKDQNGGTLEASAVSVQWTSESPNIAKVGQTGTVTAEAVGSAVIKAAATYKEVTKEGTARVTVNKAPVVHTSNITGAETWQATDNPHLVKGALEVTGTLTLAEGVEVRFDQGAGLRVTLGALKAPGTSANPIRLVSSQSSPTKGHWNGVVFSTAGSDSVLSYVTLSHCGRDPGNGGCLVLRNQATPVLRNVSVQNSGSVGVVVADDGGFGTDSTAISISDSERYAMSIHANRADALPAVFTFMNNGGGIELHGDVSRSLTWPNLGTPLVVNGPIKVEGEGQPTLTLPGGTVVRFEANAGLFVGDDLPGALKANGTASMPILFTAHSSNPTPGHWKGVHLRRNDLGSSLTHATIEYAGAADDFGTGNLNLYGNSSLLGLRFHINNLTVQKGKEYGVFATNNSAFSEDSTNLIARDNGSYPLALDANLVSTIPATITFNGNGRNAVEILGGQVRTTQEWPNLGIPYVVTNDIHVGSDTKPELIVAAGTELRFAKDRGLHVGDYFPGVLLTLGSTTTPTRFVADAPAGTKGHWSGLHFWDAQNSSLKRVVVSGAGAGTPATGNVNIHNEFGPFMSFVTFSDSSSCGIVTSTGVTTDHTVPDYNNTFTNNTGAAQCSTN